jgi:flagellar hook-associated protein 2
MSTLRLPGLLTGIDTTTLITQLMAIQRRTLNTYEARKSVWDERKDALSTLETKLSTLRSSVRALSDADELRAFSTASSDTDKLTAEASYNAFEGNHTVVINQLATAERWVHTAGEEYAEDYVGAGTFIYSYNHKETSITTTATTTLEDLVGLINNDANNPGVTASLLYYNDAYHLVLNGNDGGTDYKISVNSSTTEVWTSDSELTVNGDNATLSTKITDLISGTLGGSDTITIQGKNKAGSNLASATLDVTSNTKVTHLINEINDVFDGTAKATFEDGKIVLTSDYSGSNDMTITLTYNGTHATDPASLDLSMSVSTAGGTPGTLTDFTASDFTESQSAQDSKIRVDGFPSSTAVAEEQTLTPDANPTGGTYTLTYRGQTTTDISYAAGASTIQTALEALSTVSSGDITVADSGTEGLKDGNVTFTFRDTAGDVPMISIDFSSLTGPTTACPIVETTKGTDGYISRSSNTVDDVLYGVALHLHDTTDAGGEQITLTRDIDSVKDKLTKMVDAYNAAVVYIQEKTGYNDVLKTAGLLMGDYIVSTIRDKIRTPLIAQTSGFLEDIDSFLIPAQIGLEIDRDGLLSLDTNVFDEAIAEDYMGALAIIGADKTGSSDSNTIEFYGASSNYTTAGSYRVKVTYDAGGDIDTASIKLSSEDDSQYRAATISGNVITGDSTFDDNGDPVYPENSLQLTAPTTGTPSSTIYATVRVKQGFTGAIEDALDKMLKVTTGSIQIDQEHVADQIEYLQDKIELEEYRLTELEEYRLTKREERLVARFARLEKTLALLQNQMAALGFGMM